MPNRLRFRVISYGEAGMNTSRVPFWQLKDLGWEILRYRRDGTRSRNFIALRGSSSPLPLFHKNNLPNYSFIAMIEVNNSVWNVFQEVVS